MEWLVAFNRIARRHNLPRDVKLLLRNAFMRLVPDWCGRKCHRTVLEAVGQIVSIDPFLAEHYSTCMHCSFGKRWGYRILYWDDTWREMCGMPREINHVYGYPLNPCIWARCLARSSYVRVVGLAALVVPERMAGAARGGT